MPICIALTPFTDSPLCMYLCLRVIVVLVYGCGSTSSFEGSGGEPGRVFISHDSGNSWKETAFQQYTINTYKSVMQISSIVVVYNATGGLVILVSAQAIYNDNGKMNAGVDGR